MNYDEAVGALQGGVCVRRDTMPPLAACLFLKNGKTHMRVGDREWRWFPDRTDIGATDWEIVP